MTTPFIKMHGLGNDFVVIDARSRPLALSRQAVAAIADRRTGVGCDQLILIERSAGGAGDAVMRIHNADGGEVGACGNAARCVAALLMAESGQPRTRIETQAGLLDATLGADGTISVDMGPARFDWRDIPLSRPMDTLYIDLDLGGHAQPTVIGMGNPHAVFFVADAEAVPIEEIGPAIEHHPLFPERTNVEFVHLAAPGRLRMRVWERGVGVTRACGTGACATAVAAARRGLSGRSVEVVLDGGVLGIEWRADGRVLMTGSAAISFRGTLAAAFEEVLPLERPAA